MQKENKADSKQALSAAIHQDCIPTATGALSCWLHSVWLRLRYEHKNDWIQSTLIKKQAE